MSKAKKGKPCLVKLSIGEKTYTAEGETVLEALQKLTPKSYIGIARLEVVKDGKPSKIPLRLHPLRLRRVFEKPVEMALLAKRISILL